MTSFMSKKKKYKFQVEICLEEMLAVPFVSAVLFAKLRLLDGGSFQDHSSRQEVRDHMVHWSSHFSFPCKMMANASTGVMEKCILRISIRKECKGGRSFTKLGFVDLNLAEYAGAGVIHKRALLEGYDTRHRQDNSMLKFRIQLNMISGDILFKAPSPSLKHKQTLMEDATTDQRSDEFSSGSLAGSINSGSSGFGSLPKKRPPLMSSDLVIGQTLTEGSLTAPTPTDQSGNELVPPIVHCEQATDYAGPGHAQEPGHSRNSSNTSQMSRASGYSSISHSRQSSSGDSAAGHIRLHRKMLLDGATVTKLAPMTSCSPPDDQPEENSVASLPNLQRRPSAGASLNPSSGSLATSSEGGSLERAKATFERRKKLINGQDDGAGTVSCRVENTRVNPVDFIDELLKTTNLEQHDGSAETSRLQLFIAKDGTAAVGSQDVKSQMSTGMNMFQQVVMDDR
ncbi:protein FAM102A isoform X2 [Sitophilus oryzae]|uniref:Protein FAM102A isoform X2 n=1 Tax=Sitophilus oryzae TaxID=7048 RepID=A0A6J2Y5X0_SITOR|nr:protein FAM102A isoform X2 [Sitophilus oryzae]